MATQLKQQFTEIDPFVPRHVYQLVAAIAGNAILAGVFIKALLYPADNAEFIVNTSALIFVLEFLAIHAGGFLMFVGGVGSGSFDWDKMVLTPFQQPAAVSIFSYQLFDYELFKDQLRQVNNFILGPFMRLLNRQGISVSLRDSSDLAFDQIGTEITERIAELMPKFTQTLEPGMENNEVRELQIFLSQFQDIYPEGIVNGYYGPLTEAAVMRCQQKFGLPVTGKIGPNTI